MSYRTVLIAWLLAYSLLGCKDPSNIGGDPIDPTGPIDEVGLVTFSPQFPAADAEMTIRFDASRGNKALQGFSGAVYAHIGVITNTSTGAGDWKYVKTDWNENVTATRLIPVSADLFELKINPRAFFGVPSSEQIEKIAVVFRNEDGSRVARNADDSDIFIPVFAANALHVRFVSPEMHPKFVPEPVETEWAAGQTIQITALASQRASIGLSVNNAQVGSISASGIDVSYTFNNTGDYQFTVRAEADGRTAETGFSAFISGEVVTAELPQGAAANGVTFGNNGTTAIFALTAPDKESVYLIGDFNDWQLGSSGFMKRTSDGKIWWVQVDGLDPNTAYAYQFVVNNSLRIADPYTELVLDPDNDSYIPSSTFPNLKAYPTGKTTGIVSVMQANEAAYSWSNAHMSRPHKHDLVIYELLIRDFIQARNYETLADTLDYLSNLGVNALGLLPVNEFEGNSSWGYNPSFYFAPDKYYGTKNALKKLIDECHRRGIAVIMDMVLNHSFGQSPMVQLYFEGGRPTSTSPWFNPEARHPYNVGYDFNHESAYTKAFVKDVIKFWIEEYNIDGIRFDLSKGFTQKNTGTSMDGVGAWSQYDASRIAIWKEYNSYIRSLDNDFYVILEHFADDAEQRELSQEGMMMWNNLNYAFNEATMGWLNNSNFQRVFHGEHGFTEPNLISYMESHDEERIMFKNLEHGNSAGSYNVKDLNTALKRVELAAAFLFAAPGPKLIWQFGELGYEIPIDQNGRTGEKPILWNYNTGNRRALYNAFSQFIHFKTNNQIFRNGQSQYSLAGAVKFIRLTHAGQEVWVVGNFDVTSATVNITDFPGGNWFDNMSRQTVPVAAGYNKDLAPGEYHIYSKTSLNR